MGPTLNQAVQFRHGSCKRGGWKVREKSSSLWLQSGSCRSLPWVTPPSCLVPSAPGSPVQGRCEMCNPVYPARWPGRLPYRKCLVSVQPAQRLFYSSLAIHLSRCLRLLALVTVWGMQLPGCDVQWYVVYMLPPFPFEDRELCCVLPWTKLVFVMGWSGSLEIFFLKADWDPSVSHFELNIWIWQRLQDNRTFSGEKCVQFLLQRQTWLERHCVHPNRGTPVLHQALKWKKTDFLKLLNFIAAFGLISPSFPLLHCYFFSPARVLMLVPQTLCWNQSCPEMHTHLLKCRGGSERRLCKLTKSWWFGNLWVCLLWSSDVLRFAIPRLLCLVF